MNRENKTHSERVPRDPLFCCSERRKGFGGGPERPNLFVCSERSKMIRSLSRETRSPFLQRQNPSIDREVWGVAGMPAIGPRGGRTGPLRSPGPPCAPGTPSASSPAAPPLQVRPLRSLLNSAYLTIRPIPPQQCLSDSSPYSSSTMRILQFVLENVMRMEWRTNRSSFRIQR